MQCEIYIIDDATQEKNKSWTLSPKESPALCSLKSNSNSPFFLPQNRQVAQSDSRREHQARVVQRPKKPYAPADRPSCLGGCSGRSEKPVASSKIGKKRDFGMEYPFTTKPGRPDEPD